MAVAATLIGVSAVVALALVMTLFIQTVSSRSLFSTVWPFLTAIIVILNLGAAALVLYVRRNPDAWIQRSRWPRVIMLIGASTLGLYLAWMIAA